MFNYIKKHIIGFSGFLILTFIFTFLLFILIGSDVYADSNDGFSETLYLVMDYADENNYSYTDYLLVDKVNYVLVFLYDSSQAYWLNYNSNSDWANNILYYDFSCCPGYCFMFGANISLVHNYNNYNFSNSNYYFTLDEIIFSSKDLYDNGNSNLLFETNLAPERTPDEPEIPPVENIDSLDNINMSRFLYCEFYLKETLGLDYYDYLIYHGVREFGSENHDFVVFFINENHNTYVNWFSQWIQYEYVYSNYYVTFVYDNNYPNQFVFDEYAIHDTEEDVNVLWGSIYTASFYYSSFSLKDVYGNNYYFEENPITTNYFYSYKDYFEEPDFDYGEIWSRPISASYYSSIGARIKINDEWVEMGKENPFETDPVSDYFIFYYDEVNMNDSYQVQLYDISSGNTLSNEYVDVNSLLFNIYYDISSTDKPLYVYTDEFLFGQYLVEFSTDKNNWTLMNSEFKNYTPRRIA